MSQNGLLYPQSTLGGGGGEGLEVKWTKGKSD